MKWSAYLILVLVVSLTTSCNRKVKKTKTEIETLEEVTTTISTTAPTPVVIPSVEIQEPEEEVEDRFPMSMEMVPVYDYNGLEPLLKKKNTDTTYVVNFWATWCKPCIEELPYLEELHRYSIGKPLKVILVSLDFKHQYETKLIPFLNKHKIESDVVILSDPDSNSWIPKINETWSGALPGTLIYDDKNRLFLEMAFEDFTQIKNIVEKFNNE